jgi:LPS-assembly lipoprotein
MKRRLFCTVAIFSAAMLSACGFQLRGSGANSQIPFKTMYLNASTASPVGNELRRYLEAGGTAVVSDSKEAEAILDVLSEAREKKILSRNSQGRVREYKLYYRLGMRVRDSKNAELLAPTTITIMRDISFNESQVLAKEAEEAMLYRDMQSDLVQQILRRLAAIKPGRNPNMSVAPETRADIKTESTPAVEAHSLTPVKPDAAAVPERLPPAK